MSKIELTEATAPWDITIRVTVLDSDFDEQTIDVKKTIMAGSNEYVAARSIMADILDDRAYQSMDIKSMEFHKAVCGR